MNKDRIKYFHDKIEDIKSHYREQWLWIFWNTFKTPSGYVELYGWEINWHSEDELNFFHKLIYTLLYYEYCL